MRTLFLGPMLCAVLALAACGDGKAQPAATPPSVTPALTQGPRGAGVGGGSFSSPADLAHHYNEDVIVPIGVPVQAAQAFEDPEGNLSKYGYSLLGRSAEVFVWGPAPASVTDFPAARGVPTPGTPYSFEIRRSTLIVHGGAAMLTEIQDARHPDVDSWSLLWAESGELVEATVSTSSTQGYNPTPGPDTLLAIANATRNVSPAEIDSVGVLPAAKGAASEYYGQISTARTAGAAAALYGAPILAPADVSYVHVTHSGSVRSYTIDLDREGMRRMFLWPGALPDASEATGAGVTAYQAVTVVGQPGVFEQVQTPVGTTSLLFFRVEGKMLLLRDVSGGSVSDLASLANSVRVVTPAPSTALPNASATPPPVTGAPTPTPGAPLLPSGGAAITVGAPSLVAGKVQVPVSTTGTGLAPYSGFSIHLRWDRAVFTYSSANSTGSVVPSPLICPAGVPDADGGGVIFACAATGSGQTTAAGLLGTIVLTPTGTGCSVLHLFTYGGGDGGDGTTGTFVIDPSTADPEILTTVDMRVDQAGQGC